MSGDLLTIARSGAKLARQSLDLTAQNIANAGTAGYVRRSADPAEVAAVSAVRIGDPALSGVRLASVTRNADAFRSAEVRRTGADAARAAAQTAALTDVETQLEQSGVADRVAAFQDGLKALAAGPTSPSLRAAALETARAMTQGFYVAASGLAGVGQGLGAQASDGVAQVNTLAGQLAKLNTRLSRSAGTGGDQASLLDQRDVLLQKLSAQADVTTSFADDGSVTVRIGGASAPALVSGAGAVPLTAATASDGTLSFAVGGSAVSLSGGALAGTAQGLAGLRDGRGSLDAIAASLVATVNAGQAGGSDLNGATGQPMFSGLDAATIGVALTSGTEIATALSGAAGGSRDPANLTAMMNALSVADPTGAADALLTQVSGAVATAGLARTTLSAITESASAALQASAGVDLDQEAVNLVRYQQAFQASGRVMQVASDLFSTLLGIR
jgi:flagellar hook-associated protein 1 FlgK